MNETTKLLTYMSLWGAIVLIALQFEHEGFLFVEAITAIVMTTALIMSVKEKWGRKKQKKSLDKKDKA